MDKKELFMEHIKKSIKETDEKFELWYPPVGLGRGIIPDLIIKKENELEI